MEKCVPLFLTAKGRERRGVSYAIRLPANDVLSGPSKTCSPAPAGRPSHAPLVRYRKPQLDWLKPAVKTGFGKESAVPVHRRPSWLARHSW
jgi:hypothetical protein